MKDKLIEQELKKHNKGTCFKFDTFGQCSLATHCIKYETLRNSGNITFLDLKPHFLC